MRKLLSAFLALVLVVTLVPANLIKQVNAASSATYFIPDVTALRDTALHTIDVAGAPTLLTRDDAYVTSNGRLTISGTFSYVASASMGVKIEQLNLQADKTWKTDSTHYTTGSVQEVTGQTNRFTASNLTLFSGMNRITFTGMQGTIQRSDVFYVLYDQIPYIESLKVISGSTTVNLNEGTQAVVPAQMITLQGIVKNATTATVSMNGASSILAYIYDDGTLFTPAMNLKPGLNTLKMSISNGSNTINTTRELYFFDATKPYTDVQLVHHTAEYPILNKIPNVTTGAATPVPGEEAGLKVTMLVPYGATDFGGSATYIMNGSPVTTIAATDVDGPEIIIPGADGITPEYRLVTFTTPTTFPFAVSGGAYANTQTVRITVTYGTFTTSFEGTFKFVPGDTLIENIQYLPNYDGTADVTLADKEPLRGAQVNSPDFYILVDTNIAPSGTLKAVYLPLSTTTLTLVSVPGAAGQTATSMVYQVKNFTNGQQKVQFKYDNSTSTYNADISYVNKSYIYIENLYDGQTYEFDSRQTNDLTISGKFMGFENIEAAQYFINGVLMDSADATPPTDPTIPELTTPSFALTVNIGGTGPLVFGENRIVFKAVNKNGAGISQEIVKEVRIYLIDTNLSTIKSLMPTLSVTGREEFTQGELTDPPYTPEKMAKIFAVTPEFLLVNGKYTTSETKYDLVIRGTGASILNLKLGTSLMFNTTIPDVGSAAVGLKQNVLYVTPNNEKFYYDFAGDEKDFILRIRDIPFTAPGSHIYNLELINETGARTNQLLDVTREVSPYRVLSPQPTVGNQILVNKNFVHFDIEAEGATEVLIDGQKATKRTDRDNRFTYDFVGLKPDKLTSIKVQIKRADTTLNNTVQVYYSSSVQIDSQYMQKMDKKFDVFEKSVQLTFPKGTVLQSAKPNASNITKLYNNTMFLFGIADPLDGVVERRNDYGNIINIDFDERFADKSQIQIPELLAIRFKNNSNTLNFSSISPIYWISGGVGEYGNKGDIDYKPATNGLAPYSTEGLFTQYPLERKVIPSKRGELTLKYDTNVVDEVGYTVSVMRYTDNGSWENIGGKVDTKKHTITVPFDDFGYYNVVKLRKGFTDITNHSWARNILNALYSKGIMKNMRTDEFGANDLTTRGEFATLLVKGLNLPLNSAGSQTFFDISPGTKTDTWSYEYIETAARAGIVTGLDEGFFGPEIRITRQEAAVMIARAMKLKMSVNDSKLEAKLAKSFSDSGLIHYYSRPAIEAVSKAKIMSGTPVTVPGQDKQSFAFNPRGNMTRAEAGKIAVELLKKYNSLFPKNLS
ncbi:S-layer homology domain-containing protein [Cohnella cholangitidis]|uniref:S-layer homology domain-containing protein n=1 Tax=Cohnella cholangitidis TaxID=2598458 RepID=A0A7G5BXP4_9BACL|nr:S-layer homology domain-containing protein [Cohnella cholangitidis]QMV41728.1 S-layer homology domain-containing protein [Cohnella cholangitidis]